jgi:hypothetical protein
MSVPFNFVAFSPSFTPGRDLSQLWVVDSACSIKLTAFLGEFVTFERPSGSSRVGGVGFDIVGSGTVQIVILLALRQIIRRTQYALYTPNLPSRWA